MTKPLNFDIHAKTQTPAGLWPAARGIWRKEFSKAKRLGADDDAAGKAAMKEVERIYGSR